jgi:hypothetical protein
MRSSRKRRAALRSQEFFANLYGLCSEKGALPSVLQLAALIDEHKDEGSYLTKPPRFVQEVMFGVLAPVGRLLGYKAYYPKYSGLEVPSSDEEAGPPSTTKVVARAVPWNCTAGSSGTFRTVSECAFSWKFSCTKLTKCSLARVTSSARDRNAPSLNPTGPGVILSGALAANLLSR